jgi:hypothetical protein
MDDSIVVATASRQGTCGHNTDAAPWFASAEGRTAAAVVDGIGNSPTGTAIASLLAQVGVVCLTRACAVAVLSSRRVPVGLPGGGSGVQGRGPLLGVPLRAVARRLAGLPAP